jgi:hypothetical protein
MPQPNHPIDDKLLCWKVPAQSQKDAADFVAQIMCEVRRCEPPARRTQFSGSTAWRWTLAGGLATVIVMAFALLSGRMPRLSEQASRLDAPATSDLLVLWEETRQLFPERLAVIEMDNGDTRIALSETPLGLDVPAVFIRLCRPGECRSFITLSGQIIAAFGERFEVIEAANGGIILLSDQKAWSSTTQTGASDGLAIEARLLGSHLL